jgi:proteasome lid subunit RPN8/RPN11
LIRSKASSPLFGESFTRQQGLKDMTTTLVMSDEVGMILDAVSEHPLETAGVVLATRLEAENGDVRLLARRVRLVPESAYLERAHDRLCIASEGYVPALGEAEELGAVPIWFHTHPGKEAVPIPSHHDHVVDEAISDLFRMRSGSGAGFRVIGPP